VCEVVENRRLVTSKGLTLLFIPGVVKGKLNTKHFSSISSTPLLVWPMLPSPSWQLSNLSLLLSTKSLSGMRLIIGFSLWCWDADTC